MSLLTDAAAQFVLVALKLAWTVGLPLLNGGESPALGPIPRRSLPRLTQQTGLLEVTALICGRCQPAGRELRACRRGRGCPGPVHAGCALQTSSVGFLLSLSRDYSCWIVSKRQDCSLPPTCTRSSGMESGTEAGSVNRWTTEAGCILVIIVITALHISNDIPPSGLSCMPRGLQCSTW